MSTTHEHNRMVRSYSIQVCAVRQSLFLQLIFVPVTVADNDLASRLLRCPSADGIQKVIQRAGTGEVHPRSPPHAMEMTIGKTGYNSSLFEVDLPRRRTDHPANICILADRNKLAIANGNSLGDFILRKEAQPRMQEEEVELALD